MLDGLDAIDWGRLTHAYGEATDVPDLIRALASDDGEECYEALDALHGNIVHQGTVYEATAYAVPFLIELAGAPSVRAKDQILVLLRFLATGNSYHDAHQTLDPFDRDRNTPAFRATVSRELGYVRAAHSAVVEGVPVYVTLLEDADPAVRTAAAVVLGACRERADEIEPALRRRVDDDPASVAAASALYALCELWHRPDGGAAAYLAGILRAVGRPPSVRFVAALGLLSGADDALADEALTVAAATVADSRADIESLPQAADGPVVCVEDALAHRPAWRVRWVAVALEHPDAAIRDHAVWLAGDVCRALRPAARQLAPLVAARVADEDAKVRQAVGFNLPHLGQARQLAVAPLRALASHADTSVREAARDTLALLAKPRNDFAAKTWLKSPGLRHNLRSLLAAYEAHKASRKHDAERQTQAVLLALAEMGPAALPAGPAIREALSSHSHWTRVYAARALWKVTGSADEALPPLLDELRCRPAGMVVLDGLAEMGPKAAAAVPALERIIDSDVRLVEGGIIDEWIDLDEAFQAAAAHALGRIRTAR